MGHALMQSDIRKRSKYLFNPYEVAFCGYTGSGKTTLISRILRRISARYDIGYVKHDCHGFQMDQKGKDTWNAAQNGASTVLINDPDHTALIQQRPLAPFDLGTAMLERDFVLIEGYKTLPVPKLVFLDQAGELLTRFQAGQFTDVRAFVLAEMAADRQEEIPCFHRDDVEGITEFVLGILAERASAVPLYGLVLAGGRSTRMGRDKGSLQYHGMDQRMHCRQLLSEICERVYASERSGAPNRDHVLVDQFRQMGPLGGILTGLRTHPNAAWFVLACDLPFVGEDMLAALVARRDPYRNATTFKAPSAECPEPLCTIFEPKSYARLLRFLGHGCGGPVTMLCHSRIATVSPPAAERLRSIDTPEQRAVARNTLDTTRHT